MHDTSMPGINIAAEKKRNTWIAVGIGVVGLGGFVLFYAAMFLMMFLSPFSMFRLMPFPEFPKSAVSFQGKLFMFSEGLDFQNATYEQEPRDVTKMREFDGERLSRPQEIEQFSTVAADRNSIYFFHEGGYRTFDGMSWNEFEFSAIGNRPEGLVDDGRIWVLSEVNGNPELVYIDRGDVTFIGLPFEAGSLPAICSLDITSLDGSLNLFERKPEGLNHYVYSSDGWGGPELIENVTNYRFLTQGRRLWLYSKEFEGHFTERSFDGFSWSSPRTLSFGPGLMGVFYQPVQYGDQRALMINSLFRSRVYVLGDDGTVTENFSVGGIMTHDFILVTILWSVVSIAVMFVLVFALSSIVNRFKLRRWPAADGRTYEFASFFRRFLAHMIDVFVLLAPLYTAGLLLFDKILFGDDPLRFVLVFMALMVLGVIVVPFLYYSLFEGMGGKTPGKFLCGIRVLKDDFTRCGIGAAILRTLLRVVDSFFYYLVAAVTMGATLKWQRLGDLVASTVVVRDRKAASPARSPRGAGPGRL